MNPKYYLRKWLRDHHCIARDLSRKVGHSDSYVSNMLTGRGSYAAMIRGLDAVVHLPAEIKAEDLTAEAKKPVVKKSERIYTKPHIHKWPYYVRRAIKHPSLINWPVPNGEM